MKIESEEIEVTVNGEKDLPSGQKILPAQDIKTEFISLETLENTYKTNIDSTQLKTSSYIYKYYKFYKNLKKEEEAKSKEVEKEENSKIKNKEYNTETINIQNPIEVNQYSQTYYDLNAQQITNGTCSSSMYMASGDMTQIGHHVVPNEITQQRVDSSSNVISTTSTTVTNQINDVSIKVEKSKNQQPQKQQEEQKPQQQQKRPNEHTANEYSHILHQQVQKNQTGNSNRKRKYSFNDTTSDLEDDTGDDARSIRTVDDNKKQNHSEIEKRRRDKMNTYISELSAMVPMCHAMSRKLDKLTVLRMAVQHLKTIRGAVHSYTEGHYKPAFLSDQELKMLILQAADGFLFVVGCDRGRILYVSESVSEVLNYTQGELLGQSWFDILHPKDIAKVKEQLSSPDLCPRERLIDAKTMLPVKTDLPQGLSRMCPGARRSFFCRMKCKNSAQIVKEESETSSTSHSHPRRKSKVNSDKKYSVIQCTGYLKSWEPVKTGLEEQENDSDSDSCNLSCLVAIGRIPPNIFTPNINSPCNYYPNLRQIQFTSRHAMDGKFLFVDQRATLVLGFLPQELLGTSMYEYYHHDDITALAESHKVALQNSDKVTTLPYRIRTKDNGFIRLQSEWKSFKNPWTKDVEYLIAKNSVILTDIRENGGGGSGVYGDESTTRNMPSNFDFINPPNGREIHRIINSHVEASKIGRQIAEQVLDYHRRISESSTECSPNPDSPSVNPSQTMSSGENSISLGELQILNRRNSHTTDQYPHSNGTLPHFNNVRNNFTTSSDNANDGEMTSVVSTSIHESPNQNVTSDGNDEAAMAVIMSLLEADAGLGGPVDFTGLPWPLP